ncbi:MAG: CaiB/BaiF CoA-transferase family protein [Granulosicoccaceae bacterium]
MSSQLPLKGLQVTELRAIGPVPFAGMLLRQLGADVTLINAPGSANLGLPVKPEFDLLAAGKSVIELDLKTDAGLTALHEHLADTDVLLEGFRSGVMERLNISPAALMQKNPRLIIGRLSGFGESGPLAARAGHDINYLALSGVLHAIGTEQSPVVPINLIGDFGGGAMHLLVGILAKLVERSLNNAGGIVTTSILAGTIGLTPMLYSLLADKQWQTDRLNNLLDGAAPFYRVYKTLDSRFIAVGALEPKFFKQLLVLMQLEDTIDADDQYQRSTWPEMRNQLARCFAERDRDDWANDAQYLDCCVTPVLDIIEASHHVHNSANNWYTAVPFKQPKPVIEFSSNHLSAKKR